MGTSTTGAQLAGKIEAAKKAAEKAQLAAVKAAAELTKKTIAKQLQSAIGGDQRMRNVGKSGAKLDVRSKITNDAASITASGPWPLIESDIPRHVIGAASRNVKRQGPVLPGSRGLGGSRQRGGGIRLPNGNVRRSVIHPGTRGKQPFRKGVKASIEPAAKLMTSTVVESVHKAFG